MPNVASEARVAERLAAWLSQVTGRKHTVSLGGDPPDFIMEPEGWRQRIGHQRRATVDCGIETGLSSD
jgi:hypothetical protein